jgi:hypothetical protein
MGCRHDYVAITTGVPQIAADLLPTPKSAESGPITGITGSDQNLFRGEEKAST